MAEETVLYSFGSSSTDGTGPAAGLVQGSDGYFYGTTESGGQNNYGTVYRISSTGLEEILHSFATSGDGADPQAALIQGANGDLYGTTVSGGSQSDENGCGTVFQITTSGVETELAVFNYANGCNALGPVTLDKASNLYGTTANGGSGTSPDGTLYEVAANGTVTDIYNFPQGTNDGLVPIGHLVLTSDGSIYGTTHSGGQFGVDSAKGLAGYGTIFKVAPDGTETILHSFSGGSDSAYPNTGLVLGQDSRLYGTTSGAQGTDVQSGGTIFSISTTGAYSIVYTFGAIPSVGNQASGLVQDSSGNSYGTEGGLVYQITPTGTFTVLHTFAGGTDGQYPNGPLIIAADGNLYGTTGSGGQNNRGTVFRIAIGN